MKYLPIEKVRYRNKAEPQKDPIVFDNHSDIHILDIDHSRIKGVNGEDYIFLFKNLCNSLSLSTRISGRNTSNTAGRSTTTTICFETAEDAYWAWPLLLRLLP